MADFGIGRTGGSLRDALNEAMPMTGMGQYPYPQMMFPPQSGADQPSASVPLPQPRPPMPPQMGVPLQPGIPAGVLPPRPGIQGSGPPQIAPGNYAARLGLTGY